MHRSGHTSITCFISGKILETVKFYYNARQGDDSVHSIEKLQKLEEQQTARNLFLEGNPIRNVDLHMHINSFG